MKTVYAGELTDEERMDLLANAAVDMQTFMRLILRLDRKEAQVMLKTLLWSVEHSPAIPSDNQEQASAIIVGHSLEVNRKLKEFYQEAYPREAPKRSKSKCTSQNVN